ncbi:uncharacterized protein LOC118479141, partial [Aplysia californica]|uniref:Uncharacterized protein LOC118479141 n=1 Tax=Aplysia californica TaxID=6500 RepID=A0ABM1W4R4_APLCA
MILFIPEPDSDGPPYEFSDLHLSDTAYPNQQDDTRRATGNHTEASTSAGHQEESPYVDVDSVQMSSQDIHTPVLIGRTMAEIITPDATQTDGDGGRYNNVLVTSPVSRAAPGGQGQTHNPGTYDVIADPAREAFARKYVCCELCWQEKKYNYKMDHLHESFLFYVYFFLLEEEEKKSLGWQ